MNKKTGIPVNHVIIVAIALVVLVVLIAIFTGRLDIGCEGEGCDSNPSFTEGGKFISESEHYLSTSPAKNCAKWLCETPINKDLPNSSNSKISIC